MFLYQGLPGIMVFAAVFVDGICDKSAPTIASGPWSRRGEDIWGGHYYCEVWC
jgi:hypothetical protein